MMIIYRKIGIDGCPDNWLPGLHWYVEFHSDESDMAYPLGTAYVTVINNEYVGVIVDYLLVDDRFRRQGIATKLIDAIFARWPNAKLTEGVSDEGRAFIATYDQRIAEGGA